MNFQIFFVGFELLSWLLTCIYFAFFAFFARGMNFHVCSSCSELVLGYEEQYFSREDREGREEMREVLMLTCWSGSYFPLEALRSKDVRYEIVRLKYRICTG